MVTRFKNNTLSKTYSNTRLEYFVNNGCNDRNFQYETLLQLHKSYTSGDTKTMMQRLTDDCKSFVNALILLYYFPTYVKKIFGKQIHRHQTQENRSLK